MWTAFPQVGVEDFTIALRFRITPRSAPNSGGGADGMALVIQNAPRGQHALGDSGMGIGYAGIRNSVAIELDTWMNPASDWPPPSVGDPSANEISVHARGPHKSNRSNEKYSLGSATTIPTLSSGTVHTLRVSYAARRLTVGLDGHRSLITLTLNLPRLVAVKGHGKNAWVGVTAATGAATENHDVIGLASRL
jgi:hypothetical protein